MRNKVKVSDRIDRFSPDFFLKVGPWRRPGVISSGRLKSNSDSIQKKNLFFGFLSLNSILKN